MCVSVCVNVCVVRCVEIHNITYTHTIKERAHKKQ